MDEHIKASADAWYELQIEKLNHKGSYWYVAYLSTSRALRSISGTLYTLSRKHGLFRKKAEKINVMRQCFEYMMEHEAYTLLEEMAYERKKIKEMTGWTSPIDKHTKLVYAFLKQVAKGKQPFSRREGSNGKAE
jgi:hypothetical protein